MHKIFHPKTSPFLKKLFPNIIWDLHQGPKAVYLTFDDGPHPLVTEKTLDILNQYGAIGTFFCLGKNVLQHPEIFQRILGEGHEIGNHTFNHLKGWFTKNQTYYDDIEKANELINSKLFRPPYGKITFNQAKYISKNHWIIMWDVLSFDFKINIKFDECYKIVVENIEPGSIVTFHDTPNASNTMLNALPRVLEYLIKNDYIINQKISLSLIKNRSI